MVLSLSYGLWGVVFGLMLSAPVGPINILCMRRALFGRARDGFLIGLGAAVGDAFYAALAAFGLNAIYTFIESHEPILMLFGGLIMSGLAVRIWRSQPHLDTAPVKGHLKRTTVGALVITLANPGIFMGLLALYTLAGIGEMGAGESRAFSDGAALTIGVFVGAALWWAMLAYGTRAFQEKFNDGLLVKINHISAALIGVFAVVTLGAALLGL